MKSTINFGIPPVLEFQLEVFYKVDRLRTGLTAQQKGITARWYSSKTSLKNLSVTNPPTKENKKAAPTVAAVMPDSQSAAFP